MRNGVEIQDSDKYKLTAADDGTYSLIVLNIDPATDAGDYLLQVSSPGGNLKCTATLDIEGNFAACMYFEIWLCIKKKQIWPFISPIGDEHPKLVSIHLTASCIMYNQCHKVFKIMLAAPEERPPAPTFEKPVGISFDGSSAKFECKLASAANAKLVWWARISRCHNLLALVKYTGTPL